MFEKEKSSREATFSVVFLPLLVGKELPPATLFPTFKN